MKMKITVDKQFTNGYEMPRVKEDINDFKERFTIGDLIATIGAQCDAWFLASEVIKCEATAFPAGTDFFNKTLFCFEIIIDHFVNITRIKTYFDTDGNIFRPEWAKIQTYR